jgi:hypothetical protein
VTEVAIGVERGATATIGAAPSGEKALPGRLVMAGGPPTQAANRFNASRSPIGRFQAAGLDPVAWTLLVFPAGTRAASVRDAGGQGPWVRPDEVRPLVIDLPGGRLRVRVLQGQRGQP